MKAKKILAVALILAIASPAAALTAQAETVYDLVMNEGYAIFEDTVISGSLYCTNYLYLNGHKLIVQGNCACAGYVNLEGGILEVNGDFTHSGNMSIGENGNIIVKGNASFNNGISPSGGSIHVGGDFIQSDSFVLSDTELFIGGNFTQNKDVNVLGGYLAVSGNYTHNGGKLDFNNGSVSVGGDYLMTGSSTIVMDDAQDRMCVYGSFETRSNGSASSNILTNGTLELKGNFGQYYSYYTDNFNARENHKVVFSGDKAQTVYFENPKNSGFNILSATPNTSVNITQGRINSIGSNVTLNDFVQYGTLTTAGYTLTATGDIEEFGNIDVTDGALNVNGNFLHRNGTLTVGNGKVTLGGSYLAQTEQYDNNGEFVSYKGADAYLNMSDSKGYFEVGGDFITRSTGAVNSNVLSDGTLELKGNFEQHYSYYTDNFNARENHKIIFSGDKTQTVYFDNPKNSGFNILYSTPNTNVNITQGRINSIGSDVTLKNFVQYGTLILNGHTLNVTGDVEEYGNINATNGTLNVGGNLTHREGKLTIGSGTVKLDGSYLAQTEKYNDDGEFESYKGANTYLNMSNPDGYFLVGGDFITRSTGNVNSNLLTDGILEIKGDFEQYYTYYSDNFRAKGHHVTILSGEDKQTIRFEKPGYSKFNVLAIRNELSDNYYNFCNPGTNIYNSLIYLGNVNNLSFISATEVEAGTPVTLTGMALGGTAPYEYYFFVKLSSTDTWIPLSAAADPDRTATFRPVVGGDYDIKIDVKDHTQTIESQVFTLHVTDTELNNTSTVSNTSVPQNTSVFVTGDAFGGDGNYKYAFYYKKSTSSAWQTIGELYGNTKSVSFVPATVATYLVKVNVKDGTGKIVSRQFTVNSTKPSGDNLVNKSTLSKTTVEKGTPITILGAAAGGSGEYTYAFYYKKTTSKAFTAIGEEYGSAVTATFTPASAAEYNVRINVKDSNGTIVTKQYKIVSTAPLTNNSSISSKEVTKGTPVTLTAKASGGSTPYKYAFYYKKSTSSTWTKLGTEFGTESTATFTPGMKATYNVKIAVKDNTGKKVEKTFNIVSK